MALCASLLSHAQVVGVNLAAGALGCARHRQAANGLLREHAHLDRRAWAMPCQAFHVLWEVLRAPAAWLDGGVAGDCDCDSLPCACLRCMRRHWGRVHIMYRIKP